MLHNVDMLQTSQTSKQASKGKGLFSPYLTCCILTAVQVGLRMGASNTDGPQGKFEPAPNPANFPNLQTNLQGGGFTYLTCCILAAVRVGREM